MSKSTQKVKLDTRFLSKEDILETVGTAIPLGTLENLEILFLSFDEIGSLEHCPSLKTLTLLDNNLSRISNLHVVSATLISLCLCDQNITKMENLKLPNLRELYLHRNQISEIENLQYCPKLRKFWIFQNNLTRISGLTNSPELMEFWAQGNTVSSLDGFENNSLLQNLGLAGNPISDFSELKKLTRLPSLSSVTLSDVHFGNCPISLLNGYREFVICFLLQIRSLDGVLINKSHQISANITYNSKVRSFNDSLQAVEDTYRSELKLLEEKQKNQENHSALLNKEMGAALLELQELISDGRSYIKKEATRHNFLLENNMATLGRQLSSILAEYKGKVRDNLAVLTAESDLVSSLFFLLERTVHAEEELVGALCGVSDVLRDSRRNGKKENASNKRNQHNDRNGHRSTNGNNNGNDNDDDDFSSRDDGGSFFAFQNLNFNSPEFHFFQEIVKNENKNTRKKKSECKSEHKSSKNSDSKHLRNIADIEVLKLFRIYLPKLKDIRKTDLSSRLFTVMHIDGFSSFLVNGWRALSTKLPDSNFSQNIFFSSSAALALHFFENKSGCFVNEVAIDVTENIDKNGENNEYNLTDSMMSAVEKKVFLLISFSCFNTKEKLKIQGKNEFRDFKIPILKQEKLDFFTDLTYSNDVRCYQVSESEHQLYAVPLLFFSSGNTNDGREDCIPDNYGFDVEFASVCLSPPLKDSTSSNSSSNSNSNGDADSGGVDGGSTDNIRSIESRLELLLLPSSSSSSSSSDSYRNTNILSEFEKEVGKVVREYEDRLMEEVTDTQSASFVSTHEGVQRRTMTLRSVKEEIEKERRHQESVLKDLKSVAAENNGNNNTNFSKSATVGRR